MNLNDSCFYITDSAGVGTTRMLWPIWSKAVQRTAFPTWATIPDSSKLPDDHFSTQATKKPLDQMVVFPFWSEWVQKQTVNLPQTVLPQIRRCYSWSARVLCFYRNFWRNVAELRSSADYKSLSTDGKWVITFGDLNGRLDLKGK